MLGKKFILTVLQVLLFVWGVSLTEAAPADSLARIIEGAKKEGVVTVILSPEFGIKAQERLRKEIREAYGVDLKLEYAPSMSYSKVGSEVMGEYKAGFATHDFVTNATNNLTKMIESGAIAKVDWLPLLPKGTPREVVRHGGYAVAAYTDHRVLMYNTNEVAAKELPKRWRDLADTKWRGKFGINQSDSIWQLLAYLRGGTPEATLNDLRAVMKNKPTIGRVTELFSRYLVGEIVLAEVSGHFTPLANQKGIPTASVSVEFSHPETHSLAVLKLAKHPNAGRLVAAYLAGPQGSKLFLDELLNGNLFYPGNYEHDIVQRDRAMGLPVLDLEADEKLMAYVKAWEGSDMEKEARRILMTGK